MSLLCWAWIF